ncbi:hypothetical protein H2248_006389 [Termitomyces sp. 'cryptogamus']|nr:hypothetical protein H2248_006389 [Termitomyces sp. 'cryptogamus']
MVVCPLMSSRSRRDTLSNVESLILAQAVWEHGANAWQAVAKVLSNHSLISRPKSFFTAQSSQVMYQNLMQEAGLERTEACDAIHSSVNHKLAEKYYTARVQELRELILAEEEKFKAIVSEIEAIRAGNFDTEITANIIGVPVESTKPVLETQAPVITSSDELFDGSDLSGVSATPSSPSQTQEISATSTSAAIDPLQQEREGSIQTSIVLQDETPTAGILTPAVVTPKGDVEKEQETTETTSQPSIDLSKLAFSPNTPTVGQETGREEHMVVHSDAREEEEEDENEVAKEVVTVTPSRVPENVESKLPHEEHKITVSSSETPGEILNIADSSQEELTPVQDEVLELPETVSELKAVTDAEVEVAMEDGESSGEEPLTTSRRSTRRRRSTLSPVQQVQTRGKARRQRLESPINTRDESEVETEDIEELQEETSKVETDRDVSPVLGGARRGQGKRKASFIEGIDSPRDKKRARDDSEPVDEDETGQNHGRGRRPGNRSEGHKRFQAVIGMLHSQISQHRNGNIFHNPIKNSEAPDYHEIVKRPMDLKTIKMKVKDGSIGNSLEFQRDIMLMFANAMMYNRPGSDVHTMAEDMMIESEGHINAFRQTEGLVRGARHV